MAYFERQTARGGDNELEGIAGRSPKQLISSRREAADRDKSQEQRAADDAAAADMAVVPRRLGRELLAGEVPAAGRGRPRHRPVYAVQTGSRKGQRSGDL